MHADPIGHASRHNTSKEQAMSTHTFTMHLYQVQYEFEDKPHWVLHSNAGLAEHDPKGEWLYIGPREVTVDVPGFADMRAHMVTALREEEARVRAEFTKTITDIQARIQSLLALEMA